MDAGVGVLSFGIALKVTTRPVKSVRGSCCTSQSKDQRKTANACLRPVGKTSGSVLPSLSSVTTSNGRGDTKEEE